MLIKLLKVDIIGAEEINLNCTTGAVDFEFRFTTRVRQEAIVLTFQTNSCTVLRSMTDFFGKEPIVLSNHLERLPKHRVERFLFAILCAGHKCGLGDNGQSRAHNWIISFCRSLIQLHSRSDNILAHLL